MSYSIPTQDVTVSAYIDSSAGPAPLKAIPFKYYIADPFDGEIKGTNDEATAREYALCQDFFVVNAITGRALVASLNADDDEPEVVEEPVKALKQQGGR